MAIRAPDGANNRVKVNCFLENSIDRPMIGAPARAILRAHSPGLWPSPSPWGPETQSKSQYSSVIRHIYI